MPRFQKGEIRLYVEAPLKEGAEITFEKSQTHYLRNVMRLENGAIITLFNGKQGAFHAEIKGSQKHPVACVLSLNEEQPSRSPISLILAPLKQARNEYVIQKAVEMGAKSIYPVLTQHGQVHKIQENKWQNYMIAAAEQCGVLNIPTLHPILPLHETMNTLKTQMEFVFCDEKADISQNAQKLTAIKRDEIGVIIGAEGGFSEQERQFLSGEIGATTLSLGPRILRADTAMVAAMALVQSYKGDWR